MFAWLLAVLAWAAFVARTYTVARRRWHQPARLKLTSDPWSDRQSRHFLRATVPATLLLDSLLGTMVANWGASRFHGIPSRLCAVAALLLGVVLVISFVLGALVHRFNRPRALVPPALRDDSGVVDDLLVRLRARREARVSRRKSNA